MALLPYKPLKPGQHPGELSVVRGTAKNPWLDDPGVWAAPKTPQAPVGGYTAPPGTWTVGMMGDIPANIPDITTGFGQHPGDPDPTTHNDINVRHGSPDYSGILAAYDRDWQAKLTGALGAREAQRQSQARATINRLGVRDPAAMFAQLQQYGLTMDDLNAAANNQYSDLNMIQQQADRAKGQGLAQQAARGVYRSGGSSGVVRNTDDARARAELQAQQAAVGALDQGKFDYAQFEGDQRTQHETDMGSMRGQLAQAYQPYDETAHWDAGAGGYRAGNTIYDQYGNVIRTV